MKTWIVAAMLMMVAPNIYAQTVANPTKLEFTASADHAAVAPVTLTPVVTNYQARYYTADKCTPTACSGAVSFTIPLAKPTPVAGVITIPNIFGGIVMNQLYIAVVDAVGPGGATASVPSNPFGNETLTAPRATGTPSAKQ